MKHLAPTLIGLVTTLLFSGIGIFLMLDGRLVMGFIPLALGVYRGAMLARYLGRIAELEGDQPGRKKSRTNEKRWE